MVTDQHYGKLDVASANTNTSLNSKQVLLDTLIVIRLPPR